MREEKLLAFPLSADHITFPDMPKYLDLAGSIYCPFSPFEF